MKYALLIGINYSSLSSGQLNGCINDVTNMRQILIRNYGYRSRNIKMLTDDTYQKPTYQNIIQELSVLLQKAKQCTEIFLHYSGHGSYIPDENGDETDRKDECLIPLDYQQKGFLTDDMIYNMFLSKLSPYCKATIVIDACHSATSFDLPFKYNKDTNVWENMNQHNIQNKNIVMISGCRDDQTSSDAYLNGSYNGAMTFALASVLDKNSYKLSWKQLMEQMCIFLETNNFEQKPQLSTSNQFNLESVFTVL
jgi:hypothetical protein